MEDAGVGAEDAGASVDGGEGDAGLALHEPTYVKASNTSANDRFGSSVSISADGLWLAVGAPSESSSATGIDGDQANDGARQSGAVYVYSRAGSSWRQRAYIKASNANSFDEFGASLSLSADGTRLAVGAPMEASGSAGVDGDPLDNSLAGSGAVYLFSRSGATWTQDAYIKASNPGAEDLFGYPVALSADGLRLVVGAAFEDSSAAGVPSDNASPDSGAAYVFARGGTTWEEEAYLKSGAPAEGDAFGSDVSIAADGSRLAVGAPFEGAFGVANGAAYVFARDTAAWTLDGYLRAPNPGLNAYFGDAVELSGDGTQLAVGAPGENSAAVGVDGNQLDTSASAAGAVYAFSWASEWTQVAYLKASNTDAFDLFGGALAFSANGRVLAVGAIGEDSSASGLDGLQNDEEATASGAAYIFTRAATWSQRSYVKALNSSPQIGFGGQLSMSADGARLVVGASGEASAATGINGDMADQSCGGWCGAVYVY